MAWSGGVYTKGNSATGGWVGDAAGGIGIEAGRHDTQDNDFATGINQCVNKDGSNAFTGNPNLGGYIPTNIGAGTAAAPAICAGGDSNTGIFSGGSDVWAVATGGVERIRVNAVGSVGIGVASAPANVRTTIRGSDATSSNYSLVVEDSAGTDSLFIRNDGVIYMGSNSIGVGTNSPPTNVKLTIHGINTADTDYVVAFKNSTPLDLFVLRNDGLMYTGAQAKSPYNNTTASAANMFVDSSGILFRSTSSIKYKTDVQDATHGLQAVMSLRPVTYKGINEERTIGGLIAEEVEAAGLTEFVYYDAEGNPDALHYGNMVSLAFKAIQELNAKVEALEAQLELANTTP
jgi:hypothetical protein